VADFNFSVFTAARRPSMDVSELGEVFDSALRALGETDRWDVSTGGIWCCVTPKEHVGRSQGWKLHLSATVSSAKTVLARALPLLLKSGSAFKFASTLADVAQLNARQTPRGHSGKFIIVYPKSDEDAVKIDKALPQASVGLAVPRALSDRPKAPGRLAHYSKPYLIEKKNTPRAA